MNKDSELPPNPYTLEPIIKPSFLAGRAEELESIKYYLGLTASEQSPHIALIGERGVGKTSLLNSSEAIARNLHLLPIRIQLNEGIARSPGRFWTEVYAALTLAAVAANCWGGEDGPIYESLFTMIHARQRVPLSMAVLQFPFAMACHQGSIDDLECSDALISRDIKATLVELRNHNLKGIVLLIDEANCLGANLPLIQQFRNIFQLLEGCSLILAGTDTVFPTLTEVFSPIPRQFHRISVKRFAHWSNSADLVFKPFSINLYEDHRKIRPNLNTVRRLHELCGGDPAELQLYCHHMYRRVEAGDVNEMTLHPSVYRDVLNAYRETTPANIEDVLTAIQKLPDELLYRSRWLSRRALSAKENAQLEIVLKELRIGSQLSEVEKKELTEKIYKSYLDLHAAGITESDDNLELIGGSYTAGFWKSYVEVEKRKAWIWNDNIFDQVFATEVTRSVIRATKAHMMATGTYESSAERALSLIREGKHPSKITPQAALDMIVIASRGKESNADTEVDAILHFVREGTPKIFTLRYIGSTEDAIEKRVREFVQSRREILQAYGATMKLDEAKVWTLPSDEEVHRIGRIAKVNVPEHFGPHEYERAISKFSEGNVDATISIFERMLQDLEDPTIRNNLTFCYLLKGQFDKAEVHTQAILSRIVNKEKDSEDPYDPLWEMNFALLLHLQGKIDKAKEHLTAALAWVKEQKYEEDLAYALVLRKDHRTVTPVQGLPRGAALLLNLHGVGQINLSEAIEQLKQLYSEVPEHWLQLMDVSTNSHY